MDVTYKLVGEENPAVIYATKIVNDGQRILIYKHQKLLGTIRPGKLISVEESEN